MTTLIPSTDTPKLCVMEVQFDGFKGIYSSVNSLGTKKIEKRCGMLLSIGLCHHCDNKCCGHKLPPYLLTFVITVDLITRSMLIAIIVEMAKIWRPNTRKRPIRLNKDIKHYELKTQKSYKHQNNYGSNMSSKE